MGILDVFWSEENMIACNRLNFMELHLGLGTDQIRPDKINGIIFMYLICERTRGQIR